MRSKTHLIEREAERQSKAVKALERQWCEDSSKSPGSHGDCTFESRQRQQWKAAAEGSAVDSSSSTREVDR